MIKPDAWRPSSSLALEPNAEKAVTSQEGCIALLAGPGAGKTETLAQRADFLLRTGVCQYPKRILAISFKKDASENLKERVAMRCGPKLASRFDSYTFHAFGKRLIDIFRTSLDGQDALDEGYTIGEHRVSRTQITFGDMVPLANEILAQCPSARNAIQSTYSHVFLDEFQDCTNIQYSLLLNAFRNSGSRIIAVGDTKQKIMGWAGALEGIFLKFNVDFDAASLNLYQNFRSCHRIRRVHNRMVRDIDPSAAVPDDQIGGDDGEVACEVFLDDEAEAVWIGNSIERWRREGIPYSQIAILCNTQPHLYAQKIMRILGERKIPFRNEQKVQDLSSEPLFCLILDYLLILLGEVEPDAWERLRRVLDNEIIEGDAKSRIWDRIIMGAKRIVRASPNSETAWAVAEEMLDELGTNAIRGLSHDYEDSSRRDEILRSAKEYVGKSFDGDIDPLESLKSIGGIDAVRILTIHKCKGLEFHTVIVQGCENQTFFGEHAATECSFFVAVSRARERLITTNVGFREKLSGANSHWMQQRSPHQQFLGYVEPEVGGGLTS